MPPVRRVRGAAAPADASGDAKSLEEARSLIVTLREKEAQQDRNLKVMDRNLMIMQRHLSEERARAELTSPSLSWW